VHRLVHIETLASPQEASAREAIEELAPRLEDTADRKNNRDWSDLSHLL
jgi:hypothetical protein